MYFLNILLSLIEILLERLFDLCLVYYKKIIEKYMKEVIICILACVFVLVVIVLYICFTSCGGDKEGEDSSLSTSSSTTSSSVSEIKAGAVTDTKFIKHYTDEIRSKIEKSYSALHFEKGEIVTETKSYDTWTMSAEIDNFRLGNKAFLYQDFNGTYTTLFVPIHFTIHINQTLSYDKQTIDDLVGYARIYLHGIDRNGVLDYEFYSYFSSQYFASEELLYKHLCGNGSIVEEIPFE